MKHPSPIGGGEKWRKINTMKTKRAFVAGGHLCWFSRNPDYKQLTVNEVLLKDAHYINWCRLNLKHIRFATGLTDRIKKATTPNPTP